MSPDRLPVVSLATPRPRSARFVLVLGLLWGVLADTGDTSAGSPALPSCHTQYEARRFQSPDGIGVFFQGREIAHVMTHAGAAWLERPEREVEERPDQLISALMLRPGDCVADVGAGTGYFSFRLAEAVTPQGRVYAVDVQPEMLDRLRRNMAARGLTNVIPILGTLTEPRLPSGTVDCVLMVDVYHELARPCEMLRALWQALKPAGRLVFVEYRGEDPSIPIKPLHKMTEAQIRREAALHPLDWVETVSTLPRQHVVVFRKRPPAQEAVRSVPPAAEPPSAPGHPVQ